MLARTPWRLMTAPFNAYEAAKRLARPVVRGWMPLEHAYANLLVASIQEEREGRIDGTGNARDVFRFKRFLLQTEISRLEVQRDLAELRIKRLIKPLLAIRKPSNAVFAEAHGVNGEAGFPLTEEEVTDVVRREMYYALQPAHRGGRRHVG